MRKQLLMFLVCFLISFFILFVSNTFASEIWITEHSTQLHTKEQIVEKYNKALPKYNYRDGIYTEMPLYKGKYRAGKLKNEVVQDTLNKINYYRWLYGVNPVIINNDKMERSQKGAVILASTNKLTHYPIPPIDMDKSFASEARAACTSSNILGDSYNGNCSYGDDLLPMAVDGFVSDIYNVSPNNNVGHRLNLLSLNVNTVSFGYCNRYTALSMYYNVNKNEKYEKFYAFPSAGYFPVQNFSLEEYWSLYTVEPYNFKKIYNLKVQFIYDGKKYDSVYSIESDNIGHAIVFKMPDILIDAIGSNEQMPECKIDIKIIGLRDNNGNTVNYSYSVNFFDINSINGLLGDVNLNGKIDNLDVVEILEYISGRKKLTDKQIIIADMNKDGIISQLDVVQLLKYISGRIKSF